LANGTGTTYAGGDTYTPSANVTLYALWLVNYSITYDANGASSGTVPASQTGLAGNATVATNTGSLALSGYNFGGWNTLANGTGTTYAAGSSISSTVDLVLYAKWTLIPTFSVTYDVNGATSGSAPAAQTGILSAVTISSNTGNLARTGYSFSGWNVQANGLGTSYSINTNITISSNLTLYARWIAVFSISYNSNGATSGTVPATQSNIIGSATIAANSGSLAKNGYNYAGWNTQANGLGTDFAVGSSVTPTADLVLYAKWSLVPTFTVTYDANGATGGAPAIAASGVVSTVVLDNNSGALVKDGFTFLGWNTAANGTGTTYSGGSTFTANSNVTLYALWQTVASVAPEPKFTVTAIAERKVDVSTSATQTVTGKNLGEVNKVLMDGVELDIVSKTADSVSFNVVAHAPGMANLTLVTSDSSLTFTNFMEFTAPKVVSLTNVLSSGVSALTAPQIGSIAQQIQRAKGFKSVQLSFGQSKSSKTKISLKDNIALMKLAMRLMQMFPKQVDVLVRLTGNVKDLQITFKN
jgi:uncharacterized repeat protein (TIGR02543 family)